MPEPLFIDPITKGVSPATLFTPASVEEASELLHAGASRRATVAFTGANTKPTGERRWKTPTCRCRRPLSQS